MKEIKFRAFIDGEHMVFSDMSKSHPYAEDEIHWNIQGGLDISTYETNAKISDGEIDEYESFVSRGGNGDEIIFMQYTGLKDKDGMEIYEGDIVTAHQFLFDGNEVESVILGAIGKNDFGWTLSRIKNKFYEDYTGYEPFEGESNLGDFYGLHEESFEVIGNIHQNPEILEINNG